MAPSDGARMAEPSGTTHPRIDGTIPPSGKHGGRPTGCEKESPRAPPDPSTTSPDSRGKTEDSFGSGRCFEARDSTSSRRSRRAVAVGKLVQQPYPHSHPNPD